MAHVPRLSGKQQALFHCVNWLEQHFDGTVFVMDIDLEEGNLQLVGDPSDTQKFRDQLGDMLHGVRDPYEDWRYL